MEKAKKPIVEGTDLGEAEALLASMGAADVESVTKAESATAEDALAEREVLLKESKRLAGETKKLAGIVDQAHELVIKAQAGTKPNAAELKGKLTQLENLLAVSKQKAAENKIALESLEANPAVQAATQESAQKEHREIDPIAAFEGEAKTQKAALNDLLRRIVEMWEKDNGFILTLTAEEEGLYYKNRFPLRSAKEAKKARLYEVKRSIQSSLFKGKLKKEEHSLEDSLADIDRQLNKSEKEPEILMEQLKLLNDQIPQALDRYKTALEAMHKEIVYLPDAQRKKYKKLDVDSDQKIAEEFPFIARRGDNTEGRISSYTDLFKKFGYNRDVPKKAK